MPLRIGTVISIFILFLKKKHHFLCFNRVPKIHRLMMFGELKTNPAFDGKYITSLGILHNNDNAHAFFNWIRGGLDSKYRHDSYQQIAYFNAC